MERLAGAAQHAKALKDIIKAFMKGGWHAAALQALKHYWPQLLALALILIMLPVIVFCCLPAMMFGFDNSTNTEISSLNVQANNVSSYYDRYSEYCSARVEKIKSSVVGSSSESSGGDDDVHQPEKSTETVNYETEIIGEAMAKNWLIALHSVSTGNDLNAMSEQSIKDFVAKSIVYTLEDKPEKTETAESGENLDDTVHEVENSSEENSNAGSSDADTKILKIRYLTPEEFMAEYSYSDSDRNWAQLMYNTLQKGNNSVAASQR